MLLPFSLSSLSLTVLTLCIGRSLALLDSGIIFPLYIYPGSGCTGWSAVTSAISSNTNVQFYIIINPASGPGSANSQPDSNYQTCIASLKSAGSTGSNVKILGYVPTGYGTNPPAAAITMIDTYAQWSSGYRPDGIFFDEVSPLASKLIIYQCYALHVHIDFGTSFIIFNPGVNPDTAEYFEIADLIVTFENTYSNFNPASSLTITDDAPAEQQVVLLHTGPTPLPFSRVDDLAANIGVGASFITDYANSVAYENIPSYWTTFISYVISAQ